MYLHEQAAKDIQMPLACGRSLPQRVAKFLDLFIGLAEEAGEFIVLGI
jgi:hypothetical protein